MKKSLIFCMELTLLPIKGLAEDIYIYSLWRLFLADNIVNDFICLQVLLYFKEDYDVFKEKYNCELFYEQDDVHPHINKSNKNLIKELFCEQHFI